MTRTVLPLVAFALAISTSVAQVGLHPEALRAAILRPNMRPSWADALPLRTIDLQYDSSLSESANGDRFKTKVEALVAGDTLRVSAGTWSVGGFFYVEPRGTAGAPIRILAEPGAVLTRPDAGQNVINFGGAGTGSPARYVVFRGFEVTGGSMGIRVWDVENFWIDQCRVHDTASVAIAANSRDTYRLFVTRTEITSTGGTGEALYLGGNNGASVARDAVVALNHIHDTGGSQGDGIELKQGSHGCLIAENVIHATNYPGILCYGTGGGDQNVIEGNLVWDTNSNPFQVQGEAIVRNNVVFARNGPAFQSAPHQGNPTRLEVVHNTFIAQNGRGATLRSWANEPGMVLANNAFYSRNDDSVAINGGTSGIAIEGNVVYGQLYQAGSIGFRQGTGLGDFEHVTWNASARDAHPSIGSALGGAAPGSIARAPLAFAGAVRTPEAHVGALERGTYGRYTGAWSRSAPRPRLSHSVGSGAGVAGPLTVRVEGLAPFSQTTLYVSTPYTPGALALARVIAGFANASGTVSFDVPPLAHPSGPGEQITIISAGRTPGSSVERSRRLDVTDHP